LILLLAILNGAFREAVLLPSVSTPVAFLLSGLFLCALIAVVAFTLARWLKLTGVSRCLAVGSLWLGLTLIFEFGLGIAQGRSWTEMLAAYAFEDGNIWPVVLVVTFVAPLVAGRFSAQA
jgi:hypothetical protein